jgi:secreted PhoX family phosphatase
MPSATPDRRSFLLVGGASAIAAGLTTLSARLATGATATRGYGPLQPAECELTGLPLIKLPEGFRYRTFGWTGDLLHRGGTTPAAHDGMAVVKADGDRLTLVRNHEISGRGKVFGGADTRYDPTAPGGCSNLVFNTATGALEDSFVSLSGTVQNCAGGPTPWGTWLSGEENLGDTTTLDAKDKKPVGYEKDHGWVFEVGAAGATGPQPLKDMGRFIHEAVAVDPATGRVYLTEDANPSGFYRFTPKTPGKLADGGKLEMLVAVGRPDVRKRVKAGSVFDVKWVPVADPHLAHTPNTTDSQGVYKQGRKLGGTTFARLEGVFHSEGKLFITATSGGNAEQGQVWEYTPAEERMRILFESPGRDVLNMPDNLCASPKGCLVLCEDGGRPGQRLQALTPDGGLFVFAENVTRLRGEKNGFRGDFRSMEWSGVCFSPCGKWLFANLQTPGMTVAITGPWADGPF